LHAALDDIDLSVPENLRQMIERQIGGLSSDEQRVLEAGSVGGVEFSAAGGAAALAVDPVEGGECCDRFAQRRLFLRSLAARVWPDRTMASRYEFTHALYRHTLYQRIPAARRQELHRGIGERVEAGWGDRAREIAARLAVHFEQAGDDRRALRYLE